jgi:hypothetical protein
MSHAQLRQAADQKRPFVLCVMWANSCGLAFCVVAFALLGAALLCWWSAQLTSAQLRGSSTPYVTAFKLKVVWDAAGLARQAEPRLWPVRVYLHVHLRGAHHVWRETSWLICAASKSKTI